jgi:hypothetical protein
VRNFFLATLIIATLTLRFISLGYSDYISDEPGTFFYRGGKKDPHMSKTEFILTQRKGPLQLFIGFIPYKIVGDYDNELAQRIPFALYGAASIIIFYYLVEKLTDNKLIAFVSAFLLSTNGLIVAYGRIAQYQNLNLFFSFASLYYFSTLIKEKENYLRASLIGTSLFSLSLLAHWDAIYILAPIMYFLFRYLINKKVANREKAKLIVANIFLGGLLLLPYLVPYLQTLKTLDANTRYAQSIFGSGAPFSTRTDEAQFNLYNPFLTYYLYAILGVFGIWVSRKKPLPTIWFLTTLLVFRYLIQYSGLHFYNVFLPLVVLVAYSFDWFMKLKKPIKILTTLFLAGVLGFLYLQSYILFVDHTKEYPWETEKILFWEVAEKTHKEDLRHLTGFPHKRFWPEINDFINEQNRINNESFGYTTNEDKQQVKYYMDADVRSSDGFYAVGIKRPYSFAKDYKFPQIKGKHTVHKIQGDQGDAVVRIYRVE